MLGPASLVLSDEDLPTNYGDYICEETCQSKGYGPDQEIKVYRAGRDDREPPYCGFPMGGIQS